MTEKKKNIPELRFPEFEEEWKDNLFGSFYEFMQTYSFARNDLNYETGEIKNIHYGDIHTKFNNNFIAEKEDLPFINHKKIPSKIDENNFCRIGDLVIADASEDYNDVGKTIEIRSLGENKILAGLHTFLARPIKNKIAIGFMGYYLQTSYLKLQRMKLATGISVLGISKSNLKKVRIKLPSNPEQQKIASFLTSVDERIQQLTKKKELLEKYKKGIIQKIFSQQIRFKDDDGKDFPDWEEKRLSTYIKIQGGYAFKSEKFQKEGIPIVRISNISNNNNYMDMSDLVYYSRFNDDENYTIFKEDLLIALSGATTGKTSVYNYDYKSYLNQRVGLFKKISKLIYYPFLVQFVFSTYFSQQISAVLVAGAQPNISPKDIESFNIKIPSIYEQQKIADFLSSIDKMIEAVETQLEKTKEFKKGLLQKMFV